MKSCIYEGRVNHARLTPVAHHFSYRLFMMYLDLDELPALFKKRWLWSTSSRALARFRRSDHLGPAERPLDECVREVIEKETGELHRGPIRLLTNLSYFGYCFNPVSFYYCFSAENEVLEYIVVEVNNTPWGERETYVMRCNDEVDKATALRANPTKKMHVSPFMPMDIEYNWVLTKPLGDLAVHMGSKKNGEKIFSASMMLSRAPITARSLASVLIRFPFMTLKVILAIHWQALRLWLKRVPVHMHPAKRKEAKAL
jgi:DUF1365 family protein